MGNASDHGPSTPPGGPRPDEDGPDLVADLRTIAALAIDHVDADEVAIWCPVRSEDGWRGVVVHDRRSGSRRLRFALGAEEAPIFLRALGRSDVMAVTDAARDRRVREIAPRWSRPRGLASLLAIACRWEGRLVAALLYGRRGPPRPWSATTRRSARRIGRVVARLVGSAAGPERKPDHGRIEELAQERHLLEQVLQQLPSGVLLADADGRIILQNEASKRMFGVHAPSEEASWGMASFHMDTPVGDLPLLRALKTGERTIGKLLPFRRLDGREIWISVNAGPVRNEKGDVIAAVTAFDDVTEQRRNAQELEAEAELRERFMAILGHDLRTPTAAVVMSAQLLARAGPLTPAQLDLLRRIESSGRRMDRMIRDILDFGRIRMGSMAIARAPTELATVTAEAVDELRRTWPDRRIELDLEPRVDGDWDADRLAQVVSNLVGNALIHGSPDHPVRVHLRAHDDHACLEIRNVGPPIPPDLARDLFRPFRVAKHASEGDGLGLGLYIAHAIVSAHGGSIAVSHTGEEVVFTLRLPRHAQAGGDAPETPARGSIG